MLRCTSESTWAGLRILTLTRIPITPTLILATLTHMRIPMVTAMPIPTTVVDITAAIGAEAGVTATMTIGATEAAMATVAAVDSVAVMEAADSMAVMEAVDMADTAK